jgi:hypothetical protein
MPITRRRVLASAAVGILLTVLAADGQEGQGDWAAPIEARPTLVIHTYSGSSPGGANTTGMSASMELATATTELATGGYRSMVFIPKFQTDEDLCSTSMTVRVGNSDLDSVAVGWIVEGRLVELRQGEATIDLRWKRIVNRSDVLPPGQFEEEQRVVLREGDLGMLDLVRSTGTAPAVCKVFGLTYEVRLEGPSSLGDAAIEYDMWLIHTDAHGREVTDRYRTSARQDESADYFFRPIGFAADGGLASHGAVDLRISGTVRGRLRTDGRIDLTVVAKSFAADTEQHGTVGNFGRTLLTVKGGETVEVELPAVSGRLGSVDMGQTFAQQRTAVRITAHRLW